LCWCGGRFGPPRRARPFRPGANVCSCLWTREPKAISASSPDCDLITRIDDRLAGVQVKTCRRLFNGRFHVLVCTKGGNQSWNGVVKRFSATRCDWPFVLVADGRRWFIPASEVGGGSAIMLGGPKYAAFEVDAGSPFQTLSSDVPGGVPERSKGRDCKSRGSAFAGSNPAPTITG
jgi:hypothetical protein